jgi:mono/diheme cytochrome c family protein
MFSRRRVFRRDLIAKMSAAFLCLGLVVGCQQEMVTNSRVKPYEENEFFENGQSARPLVENTVARGNLRTDTEFYTGRTGGAPGDTLDSDDTSDSGQGSASATETAEPSNEQGGGTGQEGIGADATTTSGASGADATATATGGEGEDTTATATSGEGGGAFSEDLVTTFPFPVTEDVLARGQDRYEAYCTPCHASTGYGDGMIVRRGLSQPPSLHDQRLIDAPVGHFYDVITNGRGRMYSYASRIRPVDRWAIVAYIRALQLSQNATIEDVPADQQQQLQGGGG